MIDQAALEEQFKAESAPLPEPPEPVGLAEKMAAEVAPVPPPEGQVALERRFALEVAPEVDPAVEADRIMRRDHPYLARARELWKAPTDFFGSLGSGIGWMLAKATGQTPTPPMHTVSDAMEMKWGGVPRNNAVMAQINKESGKELPYTRMAAGAVGPSVAYLLAPEAMLPQFGFSAGLMGASGAGQAAEVGGDVPKAFAQGAVSGVLWQAVLSGAGKLPIPKFYKPLAGAAATYGLVKAEGGSDKDALGQSVIMLGLGAAHLVVEAAAAKGKVQKFPRVEATPEEAVGHAKIRIATLEAIVTGHPEMEMPGGGKVPAEEARPLTEAETTELEALKGMLTDPPTLAKSLGLTLVTAHTVEPMERLQVTLEKIAEEEKADAAANAAEKKAKSPKKDRSVAEKLTDLTPSAPTPPDQDESEKSMPVLAQGPKIGPGGQVGETPAEPVVAPAEPPAPSKPVAELEKPAVETPAAVEPPEVPPSQEVVTPAAKPSNNLLSRNDARVDRVFKGENTPTDDKIISAMDPRFLAKRWLASAPGSPERAVAESNLLVKLSPWLKARGLESEVGRLTELFNRPDVNGKPRSPLKKLLADPKASLEQLVADNLNTIEDRHQTTIKAGKIINPETGEFETRPVKVKQGVAMPVTEEGRELSQKTPGRELDPAEALDRKEAAAKAALEPPVSRTEREAALDDVSQKLSEALSAGDKDLPPSKMNRLMGQLLAKVGATKEEFKAHVLKKIKDSQPPKDDTYKVIDLPAKGLQSLEAPRVGQWLVYADEKGNLSLDGGIGHIDSESTDAYHISWKDTKGEYVHVSMSKADAYALNLKSVKGVNISHAEALIRMHGGHIASFLEKELSPGAAVIDEYSKKAGVPVIWASGMENYRGLYGHGYRELIIDIHHPKDALLATYVHEYIHALQTMYPKIVEATEKWIREPEQRPWFDRVLAEYAKAARGRKIPEREALPSLIHRVFSEQGFRAEFKKAAPELAADLERLDLATRIKSIMRSWFTPEAFHQFNKALGFRTGEMFQSAADQLQLKAAAQLGRLSESLKPTGTSGMPAEKLSPEITAAYDRLTAAKKAKDPAAVKAARDALDALGQTKDVRQKKYRTEGRTTPGTASAGPARSARVKALRALQKAITEYGPKNPRLVATLLQPYLRPDGSVADPAGAFLALNRLKGEKIGLPAVAQAFGSEDLTNAAKGSFKALQSLGTSIMRTFAPAARGPIAAESAGVLRQAHGREAREDAQRADHIKTAAAEVDKLTKKYGQSVMDDFGDRIDQGKAQLRPELQPIADALKAETKAAVGELEALGTGATDQFREDYFGRQWKQTEAAKALFTSLKALGGSKSFLKNRVLDSIAEGRSLGLEPVENNPVRMHAIKIGEMKKFVMATRVMQEYKSRGLIKQFKQGTAPADWVPIRDDVGLKDVKDVNGKRTKGAFYGPEQLATVLNNDLSMGLRTHDWFRAYLGVGNVLNQATLGLSGFHLAFTSVDAAVSQVALGMREVSKGSFKAAAKNFLSAPLAPITNALRGEQGRREYFHPGSVGGDVSRIINVLTDAGARYQSDPMYRTHLTDGLMAAWNKGNVLGAAGRALLLPFEAPTRLIMDQIVPRQKFGVAMDIVRAEMQMNPGISHEALVKKAISAWDSADNRMGQMVYDNTFMHRIAKDLSLASIRSVGWNLGTFRELLGGSYDLLKQPTNLLRGKPVELTNRAAYTLALPVAVGMLGSAINYFFTGEPPKELRDAFFPRTGGVDEGGNPKRISLPTYMKDVYHYATEPGKTLSGKIHPLLSGIIDMLNNKDFYGDKIRNSDDPLVQQMQQVATYAVKSFEPLSFRNMRRSLDSGEGLLSASKTLVGLNPAPRALNQTPAEQLLSKFTQAQMPAGGRDSGATDRQALRYQLLVAMRSKDEAQVKKVLGENAGKVTSADVRELRKEASQPPIINQLKGSITAEQALRAWKLMTPAERKLSKFTIVQKYRARMQSSAPDDRKKLYQLFQDSGFFSD